MSIGGPEVIIWLVALAWFGVWIWALVDALIRPPHQWQTIGYSKIVTVVVIVVLSALASIWYLVWVRPRLRRAEPSSDGAAV